MLQDWLRNKLRTNKMVKKVYHWVKFGSASTITNIPEITPINCGQSSIKKIRVNLLIPSVKKEHTFGGISTALKFFEQFYKFNDCDFRIISTDASVTEEDMQNFSSYKLISAQNDMEGMAIVSISNRTNLKLSVRSLDIFIATAWWSAFCLSSVMDWQSSYYKTNKSPFIYFIQDYEPNFYSASSRYLLADSTYKKYAIPVFNTKLLSDFFEFSGYNFISSYFFEPQMHPKLYDKLKNLKQINKEKLIFIYGRPDVPRNCFEIIVQALSKWVEINNISQQNWLIISAGSLHDDIILPNGIIIKSVGKLSLDEYANLLQKTYLGISLMASPHPSYPPLDLVSFGTWVITNSFKNKDLSKKYAKIISIADVTPDSIAHAIKTQIDQFELNKSVVLPSSDNNEYILPREEFYFVDELFNDIKQTIESSNANRSTIGL